MIDDPELFASLKQGAINKYAERKSTTLVNTITAALQEFYPASYTNPIGMCPQIVKDCIETIRAETYKAAKTIAEDRLVKSVIDGLNTVINAE